MKKAVILMSGGMDSTAAALIMMDKYKLYPLFVEYGQKTQDREWESVELVCHWLNLNMPSKVRADIWTVGTGSILEGKVATPEDTQKRTVVPGRNLILLGLGIAYAGFIGAEAVIYGAQIGDDPGYPDCRPSFVKKMNDIAQETYGVKVYAPLLEKSKVDILSILSRVPGLFGATYSCYNNPKSPCHTCPSCKLRDKAWRKYTGEE